MKRKLQTWLGWWNELLRCVAELHPGTITFGASLPPKELPRRPARTAVPERKRNIGGASPAPREAAPAPSRMLRRSKRAES
ncbi:MAG TPA: hypothetical protein PKK78_09170 [Kouleothrix sp.]|jgi:hypothetical protein|nr:hypothetical protein [Kouleothrix sp.]